MQTEQKESVEGNKERFRFRCVMRELNPSDGEWLRLG